MRSITRPLAAFLTLSLAGCVEPQDGSQQDPRSFLVAQQAPGTETVSLLNDAGKGIVFNSDGSVTWIMFGTLPGSDLQYTMDITKIDGDEICLAAVVGWSGGCFRIVKDESPTFPYESLPYLLTGRYGNGHDITERVRLSVD